ncbi:hypothetical protein NMY22_g9013 [Coprinellus aureogranulatus]|nr:hypothetical protein NMY22_g9013 [Coprinellus aureogranulatus]
MAESSRSLPLASSSSTAPRDLCLQHSEQPPLSTVDPPVTSTIGASSTRIPARLSRIEARSRRKDTDVIQRRSHDLNAGELACQQPEPLLPRNVPEKPASSSVSEEPSQYERRRRAVLRERNAQPSVGRPAPADEDSPDSSEYDHTSDSDYHVSSDELSSDEPCTVEHTVDGPATRAGTAASHAHIPADVARPDPLRTRSMLRPSSANKPRRSTRLEKKATS